MTELCACCLTIHECPYGHKPPPSCPAYESDGLYSTEEEAEPEKGDPTL